MASSTSPLPVELRPQSPAVDAAVPEAVVVVAVAVVPQAPPVPLVHQAAEAVLVVLVVHRLPHRNRKRPLRRLNAATRARLFRQHRLRKGHLQHRLTTVRSCSSIPYKTKTNANPTEVVFSDGRQH